MRKLYVTDLDGTLLNEAGELSRYSYKILEKLLRNNVLLTVASARSVQSIKDILGDLPIRLPIVSFNGAFVSRFSDGHHYNVQKIQNLALFDLLSPYGVLVSTHAHNKDTLFYSGSLSDGGKLYIRDRETRFNKEVSSIEQIDTNMDIMAYTLIDSYENLIDLKKVLDKYEDIVVDLWEDMYYKPWYWMSIHSNQATKAKGIDLMLKEVDEAIDCLVVFGDNTNDIEMFKRSDISIAVENAVPTLKNLADRVIGQHSSDSVARAIAEMEGIEIDAL